MRHIFSITILGILLFTRPTLASVVGSFDGLTEEVDYEEIWVYENDDITLILDPVDANASLHTIYVGEADANGCNIHLTRVSNGLTSPTEYVALNTVVELSNIQIGVFEINTNTVVPRCHIGYDFTALGPIGGGNSTPDSSEDTSSDSEEATSDVEVTATCTETDGGFATYSVGTMTHSGTGSFDGLASPLTDSCTSTSTAIEYYCNDALLDGSHVAYVSCPYGCEGGRCLYANEAEGEVPEEPEEPEEPEATPTAVSCSETDYTISPNFSGTVTVEYSDGSEESAADSCANDSTLTEYSCATDNTLRTTEFNCPAGCESGRCLAGSCEDSDGGYRRYERGVMVHEMAHIVSPAVDQCAGATKLVEYYCPALTAPDQNPFNDGARISTCPWGCMTDQGIGRCRRFIETFSASFQAVGSFLSNLFN